MPTVNGDNSGLFIFDTKLGYLKCIHDLYDEFTQKLDYKVQAIVYEVAMYAYMAYGKQLIITSMMREDSHDGDVHKHGRAIDIDVDHKSAYNGLQPDEALHIRNLLNNLFSYDPARPDMCVAIYGDNDAKGRHWNHIHIQVCYHSRTVIEHE